MKKPPNYRPSESEERKCSTCEYYYSLAGNCRRYNVKVLKDYVCRTWKGKYEMTSKQKMAMLEGFVQKCAARDVDPEKLLEKLAAKKGKKLKPGSLKGGKSEPASKAKPGQGGRFKALKKKVGGKGVKDPGAVAAAIGRAKYGKKKFQQMAAKGKKTANALQTVNYLMEHPLEI